MLSRQQQDPEPCSCLWRLLLYGRSRILPLFAGSKISYLVPSWRLTAEGAWACPLDPNLGAPLANVEGSSASRTREHEDGAQGLLEKWVVFAEGEDY